MTFSPLTPFYDFTPIAQVQLPVDPARLARVLEDMATERKPGFPLMRWAMLGEVGDEAQSVGIFGLDGVRIDEPGWWRLDGGTLDLGMVMDSRAYWGGGRLTRIVGRFRRRFMGWRPPGNRRLDIFAEEL